MANSLKPRIYLQTINSAFFVFYMYLLCIICLNYKLAGEMSPNFLYFCIGKSFCVGENFHFKRSNLFIFVVSSVHRTVVKQYTLCLCRRISTCTATSVKIVRCYCPTKRVAVVSLSAIIYCARDVMESEWPILLIYSVYFVFIKVSFNIFRLPFLIGDVIFCARDSTER